MDGGDLNLADSGEFAAKGNDVFPAIQLTPTRFLQRGHLTRRYGAPETPEEAQGDLQQ
jgi:hypothetical protein